ncbi:FGGY family carbohydrate kinase [Ilumatobacter coccineus]|uniref:Glycerol kinase n=1 Tax=Ilumatobacter coccineus (strain NBRC 103263 / KCTC 29153 / YM16-304) TaxID=1313172 RepID=A0A6C7EE99_ILUCY|nr:FGGY family carbohydrate kinase [Ilumatobacter coccineus]BAN03489.1 glycerol kinase [Ilumatobacter coccineus YM16-304]
MTTTDGVVLAVDQGTGSTKGIAVDHSGAIVATADCAIGQRYPAPGHVEQDAAEIAASVDTVLGELLDRLTATGLGDRPIVAVGLSTQRESALAWDRATGKPLGPMLGWQDRRTRERAEALRSDGVEDEVRRVTGLPIDPMFSALKLSWLLDDIDPDRRRADAGEIAVGTIDSWLVAHLCGQHRIETGNASRTQLLGLDAADWDVDMAALFGVPLAALPTVTASNTTIPITRHDRLAGVPIRGILGDSHAALFGHGVRAPGTLKATYGTGSSVMGLIAASGADPASTPVGTVRTIAWQLDDIDYAAEGNILSTGATLVWVADLLGIDTDELMALAELGPDDHGVDLVPAFAGLGAPWWDDRAVAVLSGFDLGTSRETIARAAAESIVLQVDDVVAAFDTGDRRRTGLMVDGGPTRNDWLMQLQSDLSSRTVTRPPVEGLSAFGAAHLAGAAAGIFDVDARLWESDDRSYFEAKLPRQTAAARRARWHDAVRRARHEPEPTCTDGERGVR